MRDQLLKECETAIRGPKISDDLYMCALRMRLQGLLQQEAYDIIDAAKKAVTGDQFYDGDNPIDNSICTVLDAVVGHCSIHIWSPNFDAQAALLECQKS